MKINFEFAGGQLATAGCDAAGGQKVRLAGRNGLTNAWKIKARLLQMFWTIANHTCGIRQLP